MFRKYDESNGLICKNIDPRHQDPNYLERTDEEDWEINGYSLDDENSSENEDL